MQIMFLSSRVYHVYQLMGPCQIPNIICCIVPSIEIQIHLDVADTSRCLSVNNVVLLAVYKDSETHKTSC